MPLYFVQDNDRPMHVLASSWQGAVTAWQFMCATENEGTLPSDHDPQGVTFVSENADVLISKEYLDDGSFETFGEIVP